MQEKEIRLKGIRENNLKNVTLSIPHFKLIAVTGVSGSGKSSLAFEVIAREGQRRFLETFSVHSRQFLNKLARPNLEFAEGLSPVITLGQSSITANPRSTVGTLSDIYDHLRLLFARLATSPQPLTRSHFSFNSPLGACPTCKGLGLEEKISLDKLVIHPDKSLRDGALAPTLPTGYIMYSQVTIDALNQVCQAHDFDVDVPWTGLKPEQKAVILRGSNRVKVPFGKHSLESRLKWTGITAKPREEGHYKGILNIMEDILRRDRNKNILRYAESLPCSACGGGRLNETSQKAKFKGKTIVDLSNMELHELKSWLEAQQWSHEEAPIATAIQAKLSAQISTLENLGLGYLQCSRSAASLSGGESQRIRLVNQVTADLSNVLYIFDEPSIGLHLRDKAQMIAILKGLVQKGNTVIVVEHDLEIVRHADWIIDIGPGPGEEGGELIFNGPMQDFMNGKKEHAKSSRTFKSLQKGSAEPFRSKLPAKTASFISFDKVSCNNLHEVSVSFQKAAFNVVTGVPGAGKSSLVHGIVKAHIEKALSSDAVESKGIQKIVHINPKPIGRTPRSNPATYTGLADHIRDLFAQQPAAKELGFKKSRFSFNTKGGRCEECQGGGRIQIGMHLIGKVDVLCTTCNGKRFNPETLEVTFNGKNIFDVFEMRVREAISFFQGQDKILRHLETLDAVGLGYLSLGQTSTTLSGGEAQRVKLASELHKKAKGSTLYLLDQPTTGLHACDIEVLLKALSQLTSSGNTVICIENDEQVIRHADWLVDLGPESGKAGGKILYQGIPLGLLNVSASLTGKFLGKKAMIDAPTGTNAQLPQAIRLRGVSTHLLRQVDVDIPHQKLTVVTGVSGSGKSSLAFDTLYAEAQNRFTENLSIYMRSLLKQSNPARLDSVAGLGPVVAIGRKYVARSPRSTVGTLTGLQDLFRLLYSRTAQIAGKELSARHFSFNHESGACPHCKGLGFILTCAPHKFIPHPDRSLLDKAIVSNKTGRYYGDPHGQHIAILKTVARHHGIDLEQAWEKQPPAARAIILYGTGDKEWDVTWNFKNKTRSGTQELKTPWLGFCRYVDAELERKQHNKNIQALMDLMEEVECRECEGKRLNREALSVKWRGKDIGELSEMAVDEACLMFEVGEGKTAAGLEEAIFGEIAPPIRNLLSTLQQLGLGYLSSNRSSRSLSGGEAQRIRLTRALSAQLYGVTYVLDEPTIGLHEKDTLPLIGILQRLKALGNTVVVVEHDHQVIQAADHIIEMGPGAGKAGGEITFQGSLGELLQQPSSPTAHFLRTPLPDAKGPAKPTSPSFGLKNCRFHNLKGFDIDFVSQNLIAVTGVSGSGKSTLVRDILLPSLRSQRPHNCEEVQGAAQFKKVLFVSQAPIAQLAQSTVATYSGWMDRLRAWFAGSAEAREAGLKKSAFSYLHKDGACPQCKGKGQLKTALDFMGDIWSPCELCDGQRYQKHVLDCRVHGRNIGETLQLHVHQALAVFKEQPKLLPVLQALSDVGLGHLQLGQSCKTLSGGEAQRLKLALELVAKEAGPNIYLLDEPSTGLHAQDVQNLIKLLERMRDLGHTILFVEHHPAMIAAAGQVIELGPGGGAAGGQLISDGLS